MNGFVDAVSADRQTVNGWVACTDSWEPPTVRAYLDGREAGITSYGPPRGDVQSADVVNVQFRIWFEVPLAADDILAERLSVVVTRDSGSQVLPPSGGCRQAELAAIRARFGPYLAGGEKAHAQTPPASDIGAGTTAAGPPRARPTAPGPWTPAEPPKAPPPPARALEIPGAIVTGFAVRQEGRLRCSRGAVYSAGSLVHESLRRGGFAGDLVVPEDPDRLQVDAEQTLPGRWLYGGHWMGQFGHFITETLTNLWPGPEGIDGLLFHRFIFDSEPRAWQVGLLEMCGWAGVPIRIVDSTAVRVEHLVVPERPYKPNQCAGQEAVRVWDAARPAPRVGPAVFLSRSRLAQDGRAVPGDERLDEAMATRGFEVLHPQEMSIGEQVAAAASAPLIAAVSGSALHLSAFAPGSSRVLEVGDRRTHSRPLPNQRVIDAARGRLSAFVPYRGDSDARDLGATVAEIDRALWE